MRKLKVNRISFSKAKSFYANQKKQTKVKNIGQKVKKIISNIQKKGDRELIRISNAIDGTKFSSISEASFSKGDFKKSFEKLDKNTQRNLKFLKKRIFDFHKKIKIHDLKISDQVFSTLGQIHKPIEKIGIYAPGGKAVYPSSILMTAVIAKVVGCNKINLFFPSSSDFARNLMLASAHIADIDKAFNFGGAHAIAAMAYGTETIEKSDKIFGPGNSFVAEAKRQVFGDVGIDSFAGPSEVLIISDEEDNSKEIAADLIAQAEHGEDSKCIFIQVGKKGLNTLIKNIESLLKDAPRKEIIRKSMEKNSQFIQVSSFDQALEINNLIAPEHLQIIVKNFKESWLKKISAGAIFLGKHNSAVLGDYAAGPSHVIPTNSAARFSSPVSVEDFLVRSSISSIKSIKNNEKYNELLDSSIYIAELEGLYGHATALKLRRK